MSNIRARLHKAVLLSGLLGRCLVPPVAVAASLLTPALAAAPDADQNMFDAQTRGDLQAIITKQLAALGREDATEAESFASPQLQEKFPDPAGFLDMVKQNYAALLKPRSTHFEETSPSPHGPLQKLTVVANDGTVWTVVYAFQRVDNAWRISGCGMMKQESQDI